jgi:hypothetical protein
LKVVVSGVGKLNNVMKTRNSVTKVEIIKRTREDSNTKMCMTMNLPSSAVHMILVQKETSNKMRKYLFLAIKT